MQEKRRHERIPKQLKVIWKNEELAVESITRDLCEGGAFIVTPRTIPVRSKVTLEFYPDGDECPIRCQAQVAWVNRGQVETFPPGFGVEFINMDRDSIERLLVPYDEEVQWHQLC